MKVTKVKIYSMKRELNIDKNGFKLVAHASITFDDSLIVHGVRIMEDGDKNTFIEMQKVKLKDGSYKDAYHPVVDELRLEMKREIFSAMASHI